MHAVIVAGGSGTRLRPLTDSTPKPMIEFMGQPYLLSLLRRLADAGCTRVDLLVGDQAAPFEPLREAAADLGLTVEIAAEEQPLDTAGAARRLLRGSGETSVIVCNGDILTDLDYAGLRRRHERSGAVCTLALTCVEDTSSFGVVVCDGAGRVRQFLEKPAPGMTTARTINAGTYVLNADAFEPFPGTGPLSFERDVFPGLLAAGLPLDGIVLDGHWQDLGTPQRFRDGHWAVLSRHCAWPWPPGLEQAGSGIALHRSATIGPGAQLEAPAIIGAGAEVGPEARVQDAVVMRGARIGAGAVVRAAILGPGSVIEPDAKVGPDAVVVAGG